MVLIAASRPSRPRATMATSAPDAANLVATASPIPLLPPVTTAERPTRLISTIPLPGSSNDLSLYNGSKRSSRITRAQIDAGDRNGAGRMVEAAQSGAAWRPQHDIELIAGTPAGGGQDRPARVLIDLLKDLVGVPIKLTNIAGRGGGNGWDY